MSLKTIAVLDEADLKDGQMKEVPFEKDGKVLLYRLGDKVHATSAFCTHYGAPLAKGVLTGDGRVVCPWHGACFNVCTGDIEDAPAPSAIHSFKTQVSSGKIHVTADPARTLKANLARAPKLSSTSEHIGGRGAEGVVIVGGGSGTFHAVESLRENGYTGGITILSKEGYPPIDRTRLSKSLITDPAKIELRTAAELKIKYGTNLRTSVTVTSIDPSKKHVTLDKETISYETLILAPGGTPRRLPIEGADLDNVYTFRGVEDAKKVDAAAQEGKNVVVIGSSFISMELVTAMSSRKLASIHVVGTNEFPFQSVLGKEVGKGLMKYHESKGVTFHMKSSVGKIVSSSDPESKLATGVEVNGEILPADFVVMGVGVAPATGFLKDSGIKLEKDGGIKVDEYFRVPGLDGVFAIGDIAHFPQVNGESHRVEHWNVAGNHGRAVGRTIAGVSELLPFHKVPIFWSAQGQQLRYCGIGIGYDDVIIKGNPDDMKFIAYYVKQNKVVAVSSMQNDPVVSKASELLRLGGMPSPDELRNGKDILKVDISTVDAKLK